jgi:hypothetical protein
VIRLGLIPKSEAPNLFGGFLRLQAQEIVVGYLSKTSNTYISGFLLDNFKFLYIIDVCLNLRNIVARVILVPKTETPNLFGGFLRLRNCFCITLFITFRLDRYLSTRFSCFRGVYRSSTMAYNAIYNLTFFSIISIIGVASMLSSILYVDRGLNMYYNSIFIVASMLVQHTCIR